MVHRARVAQIFGFAAALLVTQTGWTAPEARAEDAKTDHAEAGNAESNDMAAEAHASESDIEGEAEQASAKDRATRRRPLLFGRPIRRQGFHFHASFGPGIGPDVVGLYHSMEIGWSFSGYSVSLLHTFLQNRGVFGTTWGGPDEIGGFMVQVKGPLYFDDLSWKFATGVGGTVDQPPGEFLPNPGFGVHYGLDAHFPIWPKFGPTLSLDAMNVYTQGHHHFGMGLALGISVF